MKSIIVSPLPPLRTDPKFMKLVKDFNELGSSDLVSIEVFLIGLMYLLKCETKSITSTHFIIRMISVLFDYDRKCPILLSDEQRSMILQSGLKEEKDVKNMDIDSFRWLLSQILELENDPPPQNPTEKAKSFLRMHDRIKTQYQEILNIMRKNAGTPKYDDAGYVIGRALYRTGKMNCLKFLKEYAQTYNTTGTERRQIEIEQRNGVFDDGYGSPKKKLFDQTLIWKPISSRFSVRIDMEGKGNKSDMPMILFPFEFEREGDQVKVDGTNYVGVRNPLKKPPNPSWILDPFLHGIIASNKNSSFSFEVLDEIIQQLLEQRQGRPW
jgi:hypothetical protein